MLCVAANTLVVVCCSLSVVVCRVLNVADCPLCVVCCMSVGVRCSLCVAYCVLSDLWYCCLLFTDRGYGSFVVCLSSLRCVVCRGVMLVGCYASLFVVRCL